METQNLLHVGSRRLFDVDDIVLLEADENYTRVHLVSGNTFISSTTLGKIEARLKNNPRFFRTSRAFMVNLNFVTHLQDTYLQIDNCRKIILSRRRKGRLQSILETQKQ